MDSGDTSCGRCFVLAGLYLETPVEFHLKGRVWHYRGAWADLSRWVEDAYYAGLMTKEEAWRFENQVVRNSKSVLMRLAPDEALRMLYRAKTEELPVTGVNFCMLEEESAKYCMLGAGAAQYLVGTDRIPSWEYLTSVSPPREAELLGYDLLCVNDNSLIFEMLSTFTYEQDRRFETLFGAPDQPRGLWVMGRRVPKRIDWAQFGEKALQTAWLLSCINEHCLFPDVETAQDCFERWWDECGRFYEEHLYERSFWALAAIYHLSPEAAERVLPRMPSPAKRSAS